MLDNELLEQIREVVRAEVMMASKEFFTTDEASQFLGIKKSYLYQLVHESIIPSSKPWGKKLYFDRRDLIKFALGNRRKSNEELDALAQTYIATNKRIK